MRIKQIGDMKGSKREEMKAHPLYNKLMQFTACDDMKTLTDEELNRYK